MEIVAPRQRIPLRRGATATDHTERKFQNMTTTPQEPDENPDVVPSGDPTADPDVSPGPDPDTEDAPDPGQ
jgi:hypothetical protein